MALKPQIFSPANVFPSTVYGTSSRIVLHQKIHAKIEAKDITTNMLGAQWTSYVPVLQ